MTTRWIGVLAAFILLAVSSSPAQVANGIALQKVVPGNWAQVVPNATVTVCVATATGNPCTPLATIYTNSTLTIPAPNPFNADIYGNYTIYATPGVYVVCVAGTQGLCQTVGVPAVSVTAGLGDPGSNGIVKRTALNTTSIATSTDIIGLWTGTCNNTTFMRADGACATATTSAGGSNLQFQFNNGGTFSGASGLTYDTTLLMPLMQVFQMNESTATSNPTAGNHWVYMDATTHQLTCRNSDTSSCIPPSAAIQTNSVNNSSQVLLNLETSTANAVGLTVTPSNPSGGIEKFEITGSSYTGNAGTASALATLPTQCTGGQVSTGIAANGNANCTSPAAVTLQTNGVNNTSQTTLNVISSTANAVGLTLTCANPAAGNVQCEIAGSSYSGNAATATTATHVAYSGVTTGSNTIAKTEETGGSLAPVNIGQVAGSQVWVPTSPVTILVQANFTATLTGGSISSSQTLVWAYTVSSAAGESLPSQVFSMGSAVLTALGCSSGSACTITLLAPTIPAGYTSWTAYSCNTSVGPCTAPVKVATCANLAAGNNCTLTAPVTTGTAEPTVNTAFIQPTNVQASDCPPSITPTAFVQTNDLNYHTAGGMDTRTANNNTGVFTWCRQMFFSDLGNVGSSFVSASDPVSYNNAMIAFNHDHSLYNQAAQNRMLAGFSGTPTSFAGTLYGAELMQFEMDKNCNGCTINGSPDGEFTLGSFQLQDNSATTATTSLGTNVLRLQYFKAGAGQDTNGMNLVNGIFSLNNTTAASILAGYRFKVVPATSTTVNTTSAAFLSQMQNTATLSSGQIGFYNFIAPAGGNNGVNFVLRNDSSGIPSWINGTAWVTGLSMIANGTLPITGSATVTGSVTVAQATGPNVASASCTGGASQYTYELVGVDSNGGQVPGNPINTPSTCVNPLTSGNPATISFNITSMPSSTEAQFVRTDIYRTAGPMATGKIGTLTCTSTTVQVSCSTFSDTGLSASGTVPTLNTTGSASAYKYITSTNCAAVGSAANPSIAACGSASAGAFSCDVAASGGTCTVNTTAVTANSEIFVQEVASEGARLTVTCNTSPTVIPAITLASKVAATSFTINMPTITANPACFVFYVIN